MFCVRDSLWHCAPPKCLLSVCLCRVVGEFWIRKFDVALQEDIKGGRERQKKMNIRDKIDIDAIVVRYRSVRLLCMRRR